MFHWTCVYQCENVTVRVDWSNSLRWLDKIGAPSDRRVTYLWSGSPDSNFTTIFLYIFYCLKFKGVRWAAPPLKAVPRAAVARLACQVSQCFVVGHPIWRWFSKAYWIPVLVTHITKIGTRPSDFVPCVMWWWWRTAMIVVSILCEKN